MRGSRWAVVALSVSGLGTCEALALSQGTHATVFQFRTNHRKSWRFSSFDSEYLES